MIPIHWPLARRGNWDHGTMMLAEDGLLAVDTPPFERVDLPRPGSVVCFNGNQRDVWPIVREVRGCLVAVLSDESAEFPTELIHESNVLWQQYGRPGRHDRAAKWLLTGLRRETPDTVDAEHWRATSSPRLRWSFVGQKQHDMRAAFVRAVEGRRDGLLRVASGFGGLSGDGMEYPEYVRTMMRADFVLCPPGNVSADSFRVAEALEAGAIPIVCRRYPGEPPRHDYWRCVFPDDEIPFVRVDSADEIPAVLDWPDDAVRVTRAACVKFWARYKRAFVRELVATAGRLTP